MKHGARVIRHNRNHTLANLIRRTRKILSSIFTIWFFSSLWKYVSSSRTHGMQHFGTDDVVFGTHQDQRKTQIHEIDNIVGEGNVGVVCTTRSNSNLTQWLTYHRSVGVHHFFIFLDGNSTPIMDAERMYQHMPDVTVYTSTQTNEWRNESKILNLKRMQKHIHEPVCGVDRVFVQQALNVDSH